MQLEEVLSMNGRWKDTLISPTQPIRDALRLINTAALQIVMVVDEERTLLGVVTDGDIRRGLLNNLSLEEEVSRVMNTSPVTAPKGTPKNKLIALMEHYSILSVPLLEGNKIAGLETLKGAMLKPHFPNPVFIMAGGLGTRLRPLTETCPKPMLKVGDKPLLENVLNSFIQAGFSNFYISTHYMAEQIQAYFGNGEEFGVNIHYIHEDVPLGTAGSLGLLPEDMPDLPIILMNGDILTKVDFPSLLEFHNENQATATMCVREYEYQVPYGVVEGDGIQVQSMVEKPTQRYFVNAGIYVVNAKAIQSIPQNHRIDMPDFLAAEIARGNSVIKFPVHEYWLDIGRIESLEQAQAEIYTLGMMS